MEQLLNKKRIINKIKASITKLDLDLRGYTVLTEVGSGLYSTTPLIPLLAGANRVFAWTRDSKYGKASENILACTQYVNMVNCENKIDYFEGEMCADHLKEADIVTNSGFLRPLNEKKLKHLKPDAVIPLMYEEWELRETDIDIEYCKKKNIAVGGTWENFPAIKVFEHVGPLAIKLAFESGFEVFNNNIIVWSDDEFGEIIKTYFEKIGASKVFLTTKQEVLYDNVRSADFIFLCDYDEQREYGQNNFFDFARLAEINQCLGIVHLFGELNTSEVQEHLPIVYPSFNGRKSVMSYTLSHIGLNPFIDLQLAGFKVGELLRSKGVSKILQKII